MQKDISDIKSDIKEIKDLIKAYDEKKANKWVEQVIVAFITLLVLTTVYFVLKSVGLPTPALQ